MKSMSGQRNVSLWIPMLMSSGFLILGLGLPAIGVSLPKWAPIVYLPIALLLLTWAIILGFLHKEHPAQRAGRAGHARVRGDNSSARGGDAGEGRFSGSGGDASVKGNGSSAIGGKGGSA